MPRAKKAQIPTGQPYGEHKRLEEASISPIGGETVQGIDPMQQVLQQAVAGPTPTQGLFRPTDRPYEPVTTGISAGPGQGPEALPQIQRRNTTADALQRMAEATGNPKLAQLAMQARQR